MPIESEQLDRESLLLLYAAGELAPEQALALQAQLAADPSLAAALQGLRDVMAHADQIIQAIDELQRPPVSSAVAVRRAGRAMQQWSVDRMRAPAEPQKKLTGIPWWIYPGAAAAILIVSFLVWSGRQEVPSVPPGKPIATNTEEVAPGDRDALAADLDNAFDPSNTSVAVVTDDATDESGAFFISPREEQAQ